MSILNLTDEEKNAFHKFREIASEYIQPHHNDHYLLKWLREKHFDPKKAADMFCESMKWRITHGIDHIVEIWDPPKFFEIISCRGIVGFNQLGSSVLLFPVGRWDIKGMLLSITIEDIALNLVYLIEKSRLKVEQESKPSGDILESKETIILDFEGIDYTVAMWKTAWKLVARLTIVLGSHYPQSFTSVFVINAAGFIPPIFNMIKHMMNESICKIIKIYRSDRSKWVPALLDEIDPSQLPKHWGGTMVDSDGDPQCPSKVCTNMEFPKSVYMKSVTASTKNMTMKTAFVDVGETVRLDVEVKIDDSKLRWMFYTDGVDINFFIHRQGVNGLDEIVNLRRERCYFTLVEGETTTLKSGKYVVTFDNSYYRLKGKTVSYSISVIPPGC